MSRKVCRFDFDRAHQFVRVVELLDTVVLDTAAHGRAGWTPVADTNEFRIRDWYVLGMDGS